MIGEIEIYGVFFPSLLVLMCLAFAITVVLRIVLGHIGFYKIVWHRSLMNAALYVMVLGGIVVLTNGWHL